MKDIFIDADIACRLHSGCPDFAELLNWLEAFDESNFENNAYLVASKKLVQDWFNPTGSASSTKKNSFAAIYNKLDNQGRINRINNKDLQKFEEKYFTEAVWDSLTCKRSGSNDPYHIMAIFLSNRKLALTNDVKLTNDLINVKFKKLKNVVKVSDKPTNLDYK